MEKAGEYNVNSKSIMELAQPHDTGVDASGGVYRGLRVDSGYDYPKKDNAEACGESVNTIMGITNAELDKLPNWNPMLSKCESDLPEELLYDKELDKILVAYSDAEIETQWQRISVSLAILRNLYAERADEEFLSRVKSLIEGMKI